MFVVGDIHQLAFGQMGNYRYKNPHGCHHNDCIPAIGKFSGDTYSRFCRFDILQYLLEGDWGGWWKS